MSPAEIDAAADYLLRIRIGGEKIVENHMSASQLGPGRFVIAAAVQKIERRKLRVRVAVVIWRSINAESPEVAE